MGSITEIERLAQELKQDIEKYTRNHQTVFKC